MSTQNNVLSFDFGKLVDYGDKNRLDVIFNQEEDAKFAKFDASHTGTVLGILRAAVAMVKGTYQVVEDDALLRMPVEEVLDELVFDNLGGVKGARLLELQEQGLVRRVKEIDPETWYRLNWDVDAFTTEDIIWQQYDASESDFVTHNRNFLGLVKGMKAVKKAMDKGINITLVWTDRTDKYISEVLVDLDLRAQGKIDEANERYAQKITTSRVRRVTNQVNAQPEPTDPDSLGDETVVMIDGTVVSVVDLFGKDAWLVIGKAIQPFVYSFNAEMAAANAKIAKKLNGRFQLIES